MARPPKYDEKTHPQLIKWMARAGLVDAEISANLGISVRTLYRWQREHEDVAAALKASRDFVDSLVEDALLKRAIGYEVEETKIYYLKFVDGKPTVERVEKVKKHIAPDTGAGALWLKSRRRPRKGMDPRLAWVDTYRVEHDLPAGETPPEELTNDELDAEIIALEQALRAEKGKEPAVKSTSKPRILH